MKTDTISIRIDHGMKTEFTHICEEIGLSPSQAIKLFAKAVINHGGIPFELKARQPNKVTIQAIQELEEGKGHKASNASELFNDLQVKLENA
ncbi:MAG: type II toxin-antitoxin system RelB/DinJ family antitoxin [Methyloprofundus sp.]|nr:type II toxin-antitoxin system RelB/DinJ family antitoxin [Methyloprofundus sp.]